MSNMVDTGGYPSPAKGHSNPSRSVAKKGVGAPPIDSDGDFVVNEVNTKGTGSLAGQPLAKQKKSTIADPKF